MFMMIGLVIVCGSIVAAVLGVIITIGLIGGAASEIGEKVAAAPLGTFIGILRSDGVMGPLATAIEVRRSCADLERLTRCEAA